MSFIDEECTINNSLILPEMFAPVVFRLPVTTALLKIVFPIMSVIGFLLNVIFLTLLLFDKDMRTLTNFYLANLAITDLLILIYSFVMSQVMVYSSPMKESRAFLGPNACLIDNMITYILYHSTLFFVTLVSLERFMAICKPLIHRRISGTGRTVKLTICCWLISAMIGIPQSYINAGTRTLCIYFPTATPAKAWKTQSCTFTVQHQSFRLLDPLVQLVPFFICIIVNIYAYARIIHKLGQRDIVTAGEQHKAVALKKQVTTMLIANAFVFFLLHTPTKVLNFDLLLHRSVGMSLIVYNSSFFTWVTVGNMCLYLNSACNPVIYGLTNERYRQSFVKVYYTHVLRKRLKN